MAELLIQTPIQEACGADCDAEIIHKLGKLRIIGVDFLLLNL